MGTLDDLIRVDGVGRILLERRIVALVRLIRAALQLCPSLQRTVDEAVDRQLADESRPRG